MCVVCVYVTYEENGRHKKEPKLQCISAVPFNMFNSFAFQKAIDFCLEQLRKGQWVHVFPEGRVNMTKEFLRLKWGIGRLIYESPVMPIIVPMWHIGMDNILPNEPPYYLRIRNKVTINFGKPIDFGNILDQLRSNNVSPQEARKTITDKIQDQLMSLKAETEQLHLITLQS